MESFEAVLVHAHVTSFSLCVQRREEDQPLRDHNTLAARPHYGMRAPLPTLSRVCFGALPKASVEYEEAHGTSTLPKNDTLVSDLSTVQDRAARLSG